MDLSTWLASRQYAPTTIVDALRTLRLTADRLARGEDAPRHARAALVRWEAARADGIEVPEGWGVLDGALARLDAQRQRSSLGGRARTRVAKLREARSLDDESWSALTAKLAEHPEPAARVLEVMSGTGLRVGDVLRVEVADLRESDRSGAVRVVLKGGTETTLLREGAAEAWRKLSSACSGTTGIVADFVAPRGHGGATAGGAAYKRVQRLLHEVCAEAGITEAVWTHRIRRTVGVQAYRATEDTLAVRDLLQHRSVRTTEGYLSEARPDRVAALQRQIAERFRQPK